MRHACILIVLAACGGAVTKPPITVPRAPTRDLAVARQSAPKAEPKDAAAKEPRVVDLDILRISASDGGGDVATADLFRQATAAAKSGQTEHALALYRRLVSE